MKRLLLLLLILFAFSAHSQTDVYHPFPEDSARWCADICIGNSVNQYCRATYELRGKVFFNGNWYSRMLHRTECAGNGGCIPGPGDTSTYTTTFYIREDTATRIVWIYQPSYNADTIFLDFNLQVGDTIDERNAYWFRHNFSPDYCIVDSVDSISINTQYRKRFWYHESIIGFANSTIEGIGPDHGLFFPPRCGCDWQAYLHIFQQNNQYLCCGSDSVNEDYYCFDIPLDINDKESLRNPLSIFPNPFHTIATLQLPLSIVNCQLSIYNVLGKEVIEQEITSQSTIINRDGLRNGIYFVVVRDRENEWRGKVIIE